MADKQALNTSSWKRFKYTKLGSSRSIRLLRWDQCAPIDAADKGYQLITFELENVPPYEALSYAWGSLDFRPGVKIEDSYVFVTINCFLALQHLSHIFRRDINGKILNDWPERQLRHIWIDAICINQDDIEERSQQVSIMSDIYSKAERVLVWLENPSIDPELSLNIHAGVMSGAFEINNVELDRWKNPQLGPDDRKEASTLRYDKDIYRVGDQLEQLLERSWFHRVWILQEVAVASSVELFNGDSLYGGISWHDFEIATETLFNAQGDEARSLFDAPLQIINLRRTYQNRQNVDMESALSMVRSFKATDPRDKLYALFGLCEELRLSMGPADYSKSATDVWMDASRAWLLSDPALTALRFATKPPQFADSNLDNIWFPSWVPLIDETFPAWYPRPLPQQSEHGRALISFSGSNLHIRGAIVDSIEFAFDFDPLPDNDQRIWQKWHNWISTELRSTLLYSTGEPIIVTFWRTLFQDVEHYIKNSESLDNWTQWFIPEIQCNIIGLDHTTMVERDTADFVISEEMKFSIAMLRRRTRHKALFRTERNRLGIATQALKEDDVIAVFSGCSDPYILRERFVDVAEIPSEHPRRKEYTLIGPAYVHGIMDGEAHPRYEMLYEMIVIC